MQICVCVCVWECVGSTQRGGWNCQPQNPAVSEWMKKKKEEKWAEKVPKGYLVLLHIQIHRMRVTQTHTTLVNCVGAVSWGFYSVICGGKIDIADRNMALNREGARRLGGERLDSGSEFQLIFAEIRWQLCLCLTSGQRKGVKRGEKGCMIATHCALFDFQLSRSIASCDCLIKVFQQNGAPRMTGDWCFWNLFWGSGR